MSTEYKQDGSEAELQSKDSADDTSDIDETASPSQKSEATTENTEAAAGEAPRQEDGAGDSPGDQAKSLAGSGSDDAPASPPDDPEPARVTAIAEAVVAREPETDQVGAAEDGIPDQDDHNQPGPNGGKPPGEDGLEGPDDSIVDELCKLREQVGLLQERVLHTTTDSDAIRSSIDSLQRFLMDSTDLLSKSNTALTVSSEALSESSSVFSSLEKEATFSLRKPLVESLMQIHDLVFRQTRAMEAGERSPDAFLVNLFKTIEGNLDENGIDIIRPEPGDEQKLDVMTLLEAEKCPFWRKDGRVAKIFRCGFRDREMELIIRKAEVTVYRK